MIPFEIMALVTAIWVLIGAILIMPHFANKKMTQKGGKIDRLESGFHKRLNKIEKMIPKDIPTMKDIQNEGDKTVAAMPKLIVATVMTKEFAAAVKSYEGRMYAAKGIDMAQAQKGIDAAQQIFLERVQNQDPNHEDRNELMLVIRDTIQTAEQAGLIEEGSTDQKMGVVQGVMGIMDKLQARNNGIKTSSIPRGGSISSPPRNFSGGGELDSYYR